MISVIVPAYNSASTIGHQLEALAAQTYRGSWELIVADNGSTDNTTSIVESYFDRLPELRLIDASARRGAAAARNIGAGAAHGDQLAFCDADDVVTSEWLASCARALQRHDFVAGARDHESLNPGASARWHARSHETYAPLGLRFLPYALSSNMAVSRHAFEEVGGFPEGLTAGGGAAGEDIAVSWLLQLAGYELHFEPSAIVLYRHRSDIRSLWRQQSAYGSAEPALYKMFRDKGAPRSRVMGAVRAYVKLLLRTPWLASPRHRIEWLQMFAKRWGRIRGSLRQRVLFL